jgi:cytochrome d ubiquinol oxidase subunit I
VKSHSTAAEIKIPWVLGLIATRSIDKPVAGIFELVAHDRERIASGREAYAALQLLRADPQDEAARERFEAHRDDLGYALLLLRYTDEPAKATAAQIEAAAWSTVPNVPVLFWSFRLMVGLGLFFIALFATAFYFSARHSFVRHRWFLRIAFYSLPLPWLAAELGWIVAEYGRQPWAIDGVLPTFLGVSTTSMANVVLSLSGFAIFYSALALIDVYLLVRMIRRGPDGLGYWPPGAQAPTAH